jgi:hypothetical protein
MQDLATPLGDDHRGTGEAEPGLVLRQRLSVTSPVVCRTNVGGLRARQCPAPADGELGRGGTIMVTGGVRGSGQRLEPTLRTAA